MNWFQELATTYGPFGVFIISLMGSVVPFLPLPYLFVVVLLSKTIDPLVLGIAAGLGGSFGKVTSYFFGRLGYSLLRKETKNRMDALRELIGRYGEIGVFIFALTPIPDDVYFIPAGMVKLAFWRFLLANTLGKLILSTAVAYMGGTYFYYADLFLGESSITSFIVAVVAMVVVTVILLRVDWETALKVARQSGWRGLVKNFGTLISGGRVEKDKG